MSTKRHSDGIPAAEAAETLAVLGDRLGTKAQVIENCLWLRFEHILGEVNLSERQFEAEVVLASGLTPSEWRRMKIAERWPYIEAVHKSRKPKRSGKQKGKRKIDVAKALKTQHPEWSDAEVAKATPCDPSYLSRNQQYQQWAETVNRANARAQRQAQRDAKTGTYHPVDGDG